MQDLTVSTALTPTPTHERAPGVVSTPWQVPWPDGVIARYLTLADATVDISHDMHLINDTEPNLTIARCGGTGCGASHTEKWADYAYRTNNGSQGANAEVGRWAQAHASECRALPRPAATQ